MTCGQCAYPMRTARGWYCMAPLPVGDARRERRITARMECMTPKHCVANGHCVAGQGVKDIEN